MVDILSSLRTIWNPAVGASQPASTEPRSAIVNFPTRMRRQRTKADLTRLIESEIIPRLMLAHSEPLGSSAADVGLVEPGILDAFARMTLSSEANVLTAYVEALVKGGLPLETAYVDLLIPTARRLGDEWNDDDISFTDVTIGLSRLQQVVRNLGWRFPSADVDPGAPGICFVPAPGEQHAFGLFLLDDGFRRAGWRTWLDTAATCEDAAQAVSTDWFDVFGMSATSDVAPSTLEAAIARVRSASRNPDLFVMVGGRLFADDPALAAAVGADAFASSTADALSIAGGSVKARAHA